MGTRVIAALLLLLPLFALRQLRHESQSELNGGAHQVSDCKDADELRELRLFANAGWQTCGLHVPESQYDPLINAKRVDIVGKADYEIECPLTVLAANTFVHEFGCTSGKRDADGKVIPSWVLAFTVAPQSLQKIAVSSQLRTIHFLPPGRKEGDVVSAADLADSINSLPNRNASVE